MLATRKCDGHQFGRAKAARRHVGRTLAAVLLLLPLAASAGEPAKAPLPAGLTVAVLDLADVPELAPPPEPEIRRPAWRTTFGSERETRPEITSGRVTPLAPLADTDVVLIQGVQAAAPLRRLFPPSAWRLIVSRRILSAEDNVGFRAVRSGLPPTTAIAVKARQNLRVTARDLSLRLEGEPTGPAATAPSGAATAIRIVDRGRTFWLASISLPSACSSEDPPCPALQSLDAWREAKKRGGELTVIGGRIRGAPAQRLDAKIDTQSSSCVSHTIDSDLAWHRVPTEYDKETHAAGMTCISIIRLAD